MFFIFGQNQYWLLVLCDPEMQSFWCYNSWELQKFVSLYFFPPASRVKKIKLLIKVENYST